MMDEKQIEVAEIAPDAGAFKIEPAPLSAPVEPMKHDEASIPDPFEVGALENPRWVDAAKTAVRCTVTFPNHPFGITEPLDFIAHPDDVTEHGPAIFARIVAGDFGPIADYVPDLAKLDADARRKRDGLLAASDWSQLPDVSEARRAAYASYRQALRDLPSTAGWPTSISWPAAPKI
jgi:hypothetical protein